MLLNTWVNYTGAIQSYDKILNLNSTNTDALQGKIKILTRNGT